MATLNLRLFSLLPFTYGVENMNIYMVRKIGTNQYYYTDTHPWVSQYWGTISRNAVSAKALVAKLGKDVELVMFVLTEEYHESYESLRDLGDQMDEYL